MPCPIPSSNPWECLFPQSLPIKAFAILFIFSKSDRWEMISQCSLISIFLIMSNLEHLFICLRAFWYFLYVHYLLKSFLPFSIYFFGEFISSILRLCMVMIIGFLSAIFVRSNFLNLFVLLDTCFPWYAKGFCLLACLLFWDKVSWFSCLHLASARIQGMHHGQLQKNFRVLKEHPFLLPLLDTDSQKAFPYTQAKELHPHFLPNNRPTFMVDFLGLLICSRFIQVA